MARTQLCVIQGTISIEKWRDTALLSNVIGMYMGGFYVSEAGNKFRVLRTTYWNERSKLMNRVKSGTREGSVCKPKIPWFSTASPFLVKFPTGN